ncbi:hypothetical protein [Plantactinospora sp. KLBMP9567]|uniref:hypothetical protein n=1 Tax=Plantactinospora sp. KLBMP9567 TaxID=3085900 RepID=UPI00298298FD|nr:hypothetical protein [Plantactinospora sp. KLBMP9567]MDW5325493.1 hypothetical protein [Plantactinospora sp. KLBMP9567]
MIRRRTMLVAALVLLPVSAVAGCAKESRTMTPQFDEDLDARFAELRASGGSAPLRTLTSFDWDAVYCYYEGATASEVNGDVGAAVLEPGSRLMVSGARPCSPTAARWSRPWSSPNSPSCQADNPPAPPPSLTRE